MKDAATISLIAMAVSCFAAGFIIGGAVYRLFGV